MKTIVTQILTSIFEEYINPIEGYQLDVALWQGNAQLKNVTIKSTALSSHELPFTVTKGTINFIKLHFPWSSINSQPCEIDIEGINIDAVFNKNVDLRSEIEIKESILKDLEEACKGDEESQKGILSVTFSKIVDNIVFRIKDVHIRVELATTNQTNSYVFTAGLILNSIECFTINDKGEKEFINDSNIKLKKQFIVNGFSIYLDSEKNPIQKILQSSSSSSAALTESSTEILPTQASQGNTNHQLILDSFSFTSFVTRTRNERSTQTEIKNEIGDICFKISQNQLIAASEFKFQSNMFNLRCKYSLCGHPKSMPRSERSSGKWWRFVHRCTIEKRFPNRLKPDEVISMLKTRHAYLQLWEKRQSMPIDQYKKTQYYETLKNIERSLNLNTILFLRSYSEYQIRCNGNDNKDGTKSEMSKFDSTELNKLLSESKNVQSFLVSLTLNKITFDFIESTNSDKPELTVGAWKLNGLFTRSFERDSIFSVTCDLFKIFTPNSVIFQQGEKSLPSSDPSVTTGKDPDFSFTYKSFRSKMENELELSSNSPRISINFVVLRLLKALFIENGFKANPSSNQNASFNLIDDTLESSIVNPVKNALIPSSETTSMPKSQSMNLALQKICEEYPFLKIKAKLTDLQVNIENTKLGFNMKEIQINSFPIHERYSYKPETLYDNYQLDFCDLTIKMDEDIILKPVSTCIKFSSIIAPISNLDKLKLGINITSISLDISRKSYVNLIETAHTLINENQTQNEEPPKVDQEQQKAKLDNNTNITKIVMNYTSKVTICIQQVSLNLIELGEFSIIDFGSLLEISTNEIKSNFKFHDIRCNSTEKKFIDFHVPEIDVNKAPQNNEIDFSENKNAVVGFISLQKGQQMKTEVSLNSPTIFVDVEWIGNSKKFFQLKDHTESKVINAALSKASSKDLTVEKDDKTDDKSIVNVKLNTPKLVIKIPTVDKKNDTIEFSFSVDQISFDKQKGEFLFSNISLFNNQRKMVNETDISFSTTQNSVTLKNLDVLFEEPDYPLLLEFITYAMFYYDEYLKSDKKGDEIKFQIPSLQLILKDKFIAQVDNLNGSVDDQIKVNFVNIKINNLMESKLFFSATQATFLKDGDKISFHVDPSPSAYLSLPFTHFAYKYFIDDDHPRRIDFVDEDQRKVPLDVEISTDMANIFLEGLSVVKARELNLVFSYLPKHSTISINTKQVIFDKTNMPNSKPKLTKSHQVEANANNDLIAFDNDKINETENELSIFNSNDYFIMSDQLSFQFETQKIGLNLNNSHVNFDFNELLDYVRYFSVIVSGFPTEEETPINIPPFIYDVNVNTFNVNLNESTVRLVFDKFSIKTDSNNKMKLLVKADNMDGLSSELKTYFAHSNNVQFIIDMTVKECYPPIVDKSQKKNSQSKQNQTNKQAQQNQQQTQQVQKYKIPNSNNDLLDDLFGISSPNNKQAQQSMNINNVNQQNVSLNDNLLDFSSDIITNVPNQNQSQQRQQPSNQYQQQQPTNPFQQPQFQPNPFNQQQQQSQNQFQQDQYNQQQRPNIYQQNQPQTNPYDIFGSQQQQPQVNQTQQKNSQNNQNKISSNTITEKKKEDEYKNYLHAMNFILQFDVLSVKHENECISDFCSAMNHFFKCFFSKDDKSKDKIQYDVQFTFGLMANKFIVHFLGYPGIYISSLKFNNDNSGQSVSIDTIQMDSDQELFQCVKTPIFSLKMEPHLTEISMNEAIIKIDANSSIISDLIIALMKSPILSELSLPSDEEDESLNKNNYTFYQINLEKLQLVLFSDDLYLFVTLGGNLITSENLFQFEFNNFTLSFAEKNNKYEPIVKDLLIHLEKVDDEITMIFQNCIFYVSPSDIYDIQLFYGKMMNIINVFTEKSKSITNEQQKEELKKGINTIFIQHSDFVFLLCEDNRSTKIPYPFLKVIARRNRITLNLISNVSINIPCISFEIFNKKTQKWDTFIEPLSLSLGIRNKKDISVIITSGLKFVVSMQSIVQFLHFSFERQKYSDNRTNPNYIIENNTKQLCTFIFSDNSKMVIPPEEKIDFFDTRPFSFNNVLINPQDFITPQLITNYCSLSIFEKNGKRYLSINSNIILKNRGNIPLIYQDIKNNVASLNPKSITPLATFYSKFAIFGNNPQQTPSLISFYDVRDREKVLIPVYVQDKTYQYILSCKFSKKRGVIVIALTPHYIIFNHLKVPITFGIPSTMTNIKIEPKSKEYLDHVGFKDTIEFFVATQNDCTQLTTLNLNKIGVTPANFTKNYALSIKYNNLVISIKPPLIFTNRTFYNIKLFDVNGNAIGKVEGNKEIFVGTPDYFYDQQINLSLEIDGFERTPKFEVEDERKELLLKSKMYEELFLPLVMNMTIGTSGILHFNINNLIIIHNQASSLISLSPLNDRHQLYGPALFIDKGQVKPVSYSSRLMEFLLALESCQRHTIISLRNVNRAGLTHSTIILVRDKVGSKPNKNQQQQNNNEQTKLEVEFQSSNDNTCYYIVFRDVKFPQPLMITNLLDEDAKEETHQIILPHGVVLNPMSTTIVCSNSLQNETLQFECFNQFFNADLTTINSPTKSTFDYIDSNKNKKQMSVFYILKSLDNGSHLLIVSRKVEKKKLNTFSLNDFNFSIEVPSFFISLIDDKMKELALFGLINSICNFNRSNNTDFISIAVDSIQIDDMFPDTNVPVAAFNKSSPFVTMTISKPTSSKFAFKQVYIKLKDLTLYLDLNFISEIVHFVKTVSILHHKVTNQYNPSEASDGSMITMESMKIEPFKLTFSISSQTGRPTLHNFETDILPPFIPPINDVAINLPVFSKNNINASPNHLFSLLIEAYKDSLKKTICNFLPSPEGIAKGLSSVFHQLNVSSNRNINTSANANIVPIDQKVQTDKRRGAARAPVNFNQSANTTIGEGFKAFGQGIVDGFTGVVNQPKYGYQEKGASGLFGGIAKGVAGLILSPVAGVIDAATGIVDGVKNSFKVVKQPLRFPRVFTNNGQILPYDKRSAMCQIVFQRHVQDYFDYFIFFIDEKVRMVGISTVYLVFLSYQQMPQNNAQKSSNPNQNQNLNMREILDNEARQYRVHHMKKLTDVGDMKINNNNLIILFTDGAQEIINCPSQDVACFAQRIIFSRNRFCRIIKVQ